METKNVVFLILFGLGGIHCSTDEAVCNRNDYCVNCITTQGDCAWCADEDFKSSRCSTVESLHACENIINPKNNQTDVKNESLKDRNETQIATQIQPQKITLALRLGQTQSFIMKYRTSINLPIDMYFVLDFSTTMATKLSALADLTEELIEGLQQSFTNNIYIGFGSFLDKTIQPFTITSAEYLKNPCVSTGTVCEPSYGFIHRQQLNDNIKKFIEYIRTANTSTNFDPMEGGLDAVLQAAVCPDIIGWRSDSRRVMVYISDSGFHFAGDAKLAGIDKPNDGECHMEPKPGSLHNHYIYTHSTTQDYPSFGQLRQVLEQNKINLCFVVSDTDQELYLGLSSMITGAKTVTLKKEGANKIVEHIKDYYTDLSKKLKISSEKQPEQIEISIQTNCASGGALNTYDMKKPIECNNLKIGKSVDFNVSITAIACPTNLSDRHTFMIVPAGLQEALEIEIEYICDCKDCINSATKNNEKCSLGNGTYECGKCRCNDGRSGEYCQCDKTNTDLSVNEVNCRYKNSSKICEGNGNCRCGQCICHKNFQNTFCECDTSKCFAPGSTEKCSNKGDCICDYCKCKNDYYSTYCECPPKAGCIANNSGIVCSDHGECKCGMCFCHSGYTGMYCENCPRCDKCRRCAYTECVKAWQIPNQNETVAAHCKDINVTMVDKFQRNLEPCAIINSPDCEINYLVTCDDNNNVYLQIAKTKLCSSQPDALLIAFPVLGGILGVGVLLLIIWKILTSFYDKIEYAKFEHEITNPKWTKGENPIYNSPVTTNQNPVYKGEIAD